MTRHTPVVGHSAFNKAVWANNPVDIGWFALGPNSPLTNNPPASRPDHNPEWRAEEFRNLIEALHAIARAAETPAP